jgi:hypothetical protein
LRRDADSLVLHRGAMLLCGMFARRLLAGATYAVLTSGLALAHHIPVPLSHVMGSEILDSVVYYRQATNLGIPAYLPGAAEIEHHAAMELQPGDYFTISAKGRTEVIEVEEGDFRDFGNVEMEEFLSLIATKTSLVEVEHENGFVVFRGNAVERQPRIGRRHPVLRTDVAEGAMPS